MRPGPTEMRTQVFEFAKVARIAVHRTGNDFPHALVEEEKRVMGLGAEVIQVWLMLSWPWVGDLVHLMRGRGYFTGGVLPRWFGEDGLLMQKLTGQPNWEGIQLYSDRAEEIRRMVRQDWADVR